jgi:gas vesicle protein
MQATRNRQCDVLSSTGAGSLVPWTVLQLQSWNLRPNSLDRRGVYLRLSVRRSYSTRAAIDFNLRPTGQFCYAQAIFRLGERRVFIMAEDNKIHHLGWFIAGLGVGAVVGILYAPKSGKETRESLANSAREGSEYVRVKSQQAAEQVGVLVDKGKEQVSTLVDKGKEQVSTLVDKSKDLVDKSKEQVAEYVDRSREVVDRGRAQWEEFVERGKSLVTDQTTRVSAAVEAGRNAYRTTTVDPTEL